jgi:hypothetical protein
MFQTQALTGLPHLLCNDRYELVNAAIMTESARSELRTDGPQKVAHVRLPAKRGGVFLWQRNNGCWNGDDAEAI